MSLTEHSVCCQAYSHGILLGHTEAWMPGMDGENNSIHINKMVSAILFLDWVC